MEWYDIIFIIFIFFFIFVFCPIKISGECSKEEEEKDDEINFLAKGKENELDDDIFMNEVLDQMRIDETFVKKEDDKNE